jgi:acetyl esterase/lipase
LHFPLLAPDNLLARLPPSYIVVAEKDTVRDDGVVLQKRLTDLGVHAKLQYYSGLPHHFHVFSALSIAHEMMADTVEGARWVLAEDEGKSGRAGEGENE